MEKGVEAHAKPYDNYDNKLSLFKIQENINEKQ